MRERVFTQGDTPDKRLDQVERTLHHFKRRMSTKVGVEVPPVPISWFCEEPDSEGIMMRYMFPARGSIESGAVKIENFPSDQKRVTFVADIHTSDESSQKFFDLKDQVNLFPIQMKVEPGARFELRLNDPSINISRIWIAFLYHIDFSKARLQTMLVDELDKLEKQNERI